MEKVTQKQLDKMIRDYNNGIDVDFKFKDYSGLEFCNVSFECSDTTERQFF